MLSFLFFIVARTVYARLYDNGDDYCNFTFKGFIPVFNLEKFSFLDDLLVPKSLWWMIKVHDKRGKEFKRKLVLTITLNNFLRFYFNSRFN